MSPISPGVYSKIIDLSTYVASVPSTIGVVCALTEKGEDNKFKLIGSRADLISEFGTPNINTYSKVYGQGLYCAYNFLGESGSLYFLRALPSDAKYANLKISSEMVGTDNTSTISVSYEDSVNSKAELITGLQVSGPSNPICILYPIGRGEYYNGLAVKFTEHSNPTLFEVYVMDIYEKQSDGDEVIIESFEVSFDPTAMDNSGDSMWITYVLQTYSSVLRAAMVLVDGDYSPGFYDVVKVYDKNIGTVTLNEDVGCITDSKQDFSQWAATDGTAAYMIIAIDGRGHRVYGWLKDTNGSDKTTINVYDSRIFANGYQAWKGSEDFNITYGVTYYIKKNYGNIASSFGYEIPLASGSDGLLKRADGTLNTDSTGAEKLLVDAYGGTLVNPITSDLEDSIDDTENVYFNMVFDCGYPDDVKTAISSLVQNRKDCVAILDNGDNPNCNAALAKRKADHPFNNYYCALYEPYNKVYDQFTGQDVWFSPIYHISYILPRNDTVAELWYAAAGFNRASIDTIKELRYNPKLGQRDSMYQEQLNPIVKFNEGYVVWGQLTSQAKASALQDLNIVRLVLYIKRALEQYCRAFIFEMNDVMTWSQVSGNIVEFLESIKKKRGLYSYSIDVGATDYEKKTKMFHCNVTLNPTRVVEQILLNFFIQ